MIQYTKAFIQSLLDKYMEGTTTLEEEDILHQYFTRSDVPAEWEDYRQLFAEIDSMRPAEKIQWRWWPWSVAAAVVAVLVVFAVIQSPQENLSKSDVIAQVEGKEKAQYNHQTHPQPLPCREGRRYSSPLYSASKVIPPLPTREGLGVGLSGEALMAEAAKEQQQAEQEMEQAQQEILHAQLTAAGYVAIQQEDGTIIYTNEPKEYFAYEE